MIIKDTWNWALLVTFVLLIAAGCVGHRYLKTTSTTVTNVVMVPHPLGPRLMTNIVTVPAFALMAAVATNISLVHTTITLTNLDYAVGLPVDWTNKLGQRFRYTNRVWFWECSTNLKNWTYDGWHTNHVVTIQMTNQMRFYRGWNIPHGRSLRVGPGNPQPPDL